MAVKAINALLKFRDKICLIVDYWSGLFVYKLYLKKNRLKRLNKTSTVFWHILTVCLFVSIPFFTVTLQYNEIKNIKKPPMLHPESIWAQAVYLRFCCQNLILAGQFYFIYLFLAPKVLYSKKNYLKYALLSLITILIFIFLIHFFHMFVDGRIGKHVLPIKIRFIDTFLYSFAMIILATALHLYNSYFELQTIQQESEVQFLRSQINPHFLFNSLNNIYSLIVLRSNNAADAMLKLSDILRFVLYETSEKYILLKNELKYISDYIALQQLRLNENVKVLFSINEKCTTEKIHPMLLIPFIENAFKHGISYSEPCSIEVYLELKDRILKMRVRNSIFKNNTDELRKESGIGLSNVKRRLELLYFGKYQLHEIINEKQHEIILILELHEN